MMFRRSACAIGIAVIVAACGVSESGDPSSSTTITFVPFETSWSHASGLTAEVRADLEAALGQAGGWALVPSSETPPALVADTVEIRVTRAMPADLAGSDLVVRRADLSVLVSLQAVAAGDVSICEKAGAGWAPRPVRGLPGCALLAADAVSYVAWTEDGQDFLAQFGPEVGDAVVVGWLATWEAVGSA